MLVEEAQQKKAAQLRSLLYITYGLAGRQNEAPVERPDINCSSTTQYVHVHEEYQQ